MAGNKLTPFCAVFSGDGRDSVALSKRREREVKAILEDDLHQALTSWTGATRRAKDERFLEDSERWIRCHSAEAGAGCAQRADPTICRHNARVAGSDPRADRLSCRSTSNMAE